MILEARNLVCIACPLGCKLEVTKDSINEGEFAVSGNKCPRGLDYGMKEMTNPTRVLTTTVRISNAQLKRIPVRTNGAIPKAKIFEAMELINRIEVKAPVKVGQVIIKDILGTGVDIIASRSIYEMGDITSHYCHSKGSQLNKMVI